MASPICEINSTSLGAWTDTTDGVDVALGETISVRLADSAGSRLWQLEVIGTDESVAAPAITQASVVSGVATFTAPSTPTDGWALVIRSTVGVQALGRDALNGLQAAYVSTFGVYFLTAVGGRVGALNEMYEGSAEFGWITKLNALAKAPPGAGGPPSGSAAGDLKFTFPAPGVARVNGRYFPWKGTARFAITGNIANLASFTVAQSEGTAVAGDVVLLTAQTTASQNGLYTVGTVGGGSAALTRASDMAASQDTLAGSVVRVTEGSVWANTTWTLTTQGTITLGSTSLVFTPNRAQTVASLRLVAGKVSGETIELPFYSSIGDGGGGTFIWKTGTQPADNGGVDIVPTVTTAGWWQRRYSGAINVKWFGVKGDGNNATDDSVAVNALFAWAKANLQSIHVIFPSVGNAGQTLYYNFRQKILVRGSLGVTIRIEGENTSPNGIGGVRLNLASDIGAAIDSFIDLKGCNDIHLSNLDIVANGKAKYVVWFHPDLDVSPGVGASKLVGHNVNIRYPQDVAGACCLGAGPNVSDTGIGGDGTSLNQSDNVTLYDSRLQGLGGAGYNPVGFRNISGGNAKLFSFYNVNIGSLKYAYDFASTSGSVNIYGGGVSSCSTAAFYASSSQISANGFDFETNDRDCKLLVGSFGAGSGTVSFYDCEINYQDGTVGTATNDVIANWTGGLISFEKCTIVNHRILVITNATNANPIVLTVGASHGIVVGDRIQIRGVLGNTAANTAARAFTTVTATGSTTITIDAVGNGAYTSGGIAQLEPKIFVSNNVWGSGTEMAGVHSLGSVWVNCASNLPVYDQNGARMLDGANAQVRPVQVVSINDCGFQLGQAAPYKLTPTFGRAPRWASLGAGFLQTDAEGNMTAGALSTSLPDATTSVKGIVKLAQDIAGTALLPTVVGLTGTTGTVAMHGTKVLWDSNGPSTETSSGDMVLRVNTAGKNFSFFDTTNRVFDLNYNSGNAYFQLPSNISSLNVFANTAGGQFVRFQASTMYLDADLNFRSISSTQRMSVTGSGVTMDSLAGTGSRLVFASAAGLLSAPATGSTGQVHAVVSGSPAWSTPGGDVTGAPSASTVVQLTGSSNSVAIPSGTHLDWASGPTIAKGGASSSGLQLKVNAGSEALSFYETTNRAWSTAWNSGNPYIQLGSSATSLQITADVGTSQSIRLLVAGTTPVGLVFAADTIDFTRGNATAKGRWTNTGIRVGDATNPTRALEVAGEMGIDGQIIWSSASSAAIINAKTNTPVVIMINGVNKAEFDPNGVFAITDATSVPAAGSNPTGSGWIYEDVGRLFHKGKNGLTTTLGGDGASAGAPSYSDRRYGSCTTTSTTGVDITWADGNAYIDLAALYGSGPKTVSVDVTVHGIDTSDNNMMVFRRIACFFLTSGNVLIPEGVGDEVNTSGGFAGATPTSESLTIAVVSSTTRIRVTPAGATSRTYKWFAEARALAFTVN